MQKKLFYILSFYCFFSLQSFSQDEYAEYHFEPKAKSGNSNISGFHLGGNGNILFPTGGITGATYSSGIGLGVFAKYILEAKIGIGASANVDLLRYRGGAAPGVTTSLTNINGLLEYYFGDGSTPYIGLEFGHYTLNTTFSAATSSSSNAMSYSSSSFGFAPYVGYIMDISKNIFISGNIKYIRTISSLIGVNTPTQFLQLNIGVSYKL